MTPAELAKLLEAANKWMEEARPLLARGGQFECDYKKLVAELDACLKLEPKAVRCCEGGGPENIAASVAITMASLRKDLEDALAHNVELKEKNAALVDASRTFSSRWLKPRL